MRLMWVGEKYMVQREWKLVGEITRKILLLMLVKHEGIGKVPVGNLAY